MIKNYSITKEQADKLKAKAESIGVSASGILAALIDQLDRLDEDGFLDAAIDGRKTNGKNRGEDGRFEVKK